MKSLLLLLLLSTSVLAAPVRTETEARAFKEGCDQSQTNMNVCAKYDYKVADDALNVAYQRQIKRLNSVSKTRLVAAQRAWVKYIQSDCEGQAGSAQDGGTNWSVEYYGCLTTHTTTRTALLR